MTASQTVITEVQRLVAEAASEIGYRERPMGSNLTKFAAEAGHVPGRAWCATFVVAVARRAGIPLPSRSPSTRVMADAFRRTGRWHESDPRPGELAFFWFDRPDGQVQHVGIVERVLPATVVTIDGNTSSAQSGGSEDAGGVVARRWRRRSTVVGYGRVTGAFEP